MGFNIGKEYVVMRDEYMFDKELFRSENQQAAMLALMAYKSDHPDWNIKIKEYDIRTM